MRNYWNRRQSNYSWDQMKPSLETKKHQWFYIYVYICKTQRRNKQQINEKQKQKHSNNK